MSNVPPRLEHTNPGQPPPPVKSGSRGWMILAIVLGALLFCLLVAPITLGFMIGGLYDATGKSHGMQEVTVEDHQARKKVAVISISGIILRAGEEAGGDIVKRIDQQLDQAGEDPSIRGVVLEINSPGGEVLASDAIYRRINQFQSKTDKPVVASMGSVAASGGYYVAVPCDWIVANPLTLTGSIGVIMQTYNYRSLMDKVGIKPLIFKSGRFKDMLRGSKSEEEILPEARKMVQNLVDQSFGRFKDIVEEGRTASWKAHGKEGARKLTEDWQTYADGRILSGKEAYDYGFVDELGTLETAFDRVKSLAGVQEANLIRYQRPWSMRDLLPVIKQASDNTVKVDFGVEMPQLRGGHLYYLAAPLFQ